MEEIWSGAGAKGKSQSRETVWAPLPPMELDQQQRNAQRRRFALWSCCAASAFAAEASQAPLGGPRRIARRRSRPHPERGRYGLQGARSQRAGAPYEILVFADEGHGVRKPENLRVLYQRLIAFFGTAVAD